MAVHLAGTMVTVGQYAVQRCLLCGAALMEFNARNIASSDGRGLTQLLVGGFYEVDEHRTVFVSETETPHFASDLDLPDGCCVRDK